MDHQQKPTDHSTLEACHQCKGGCREHRDDSGRSASKVIPWPQSPSSKVAASTITNVQIALEDQTYADHLRGLLEQDGKHRVYVVAKPIPTIAGVVVLDEATLGQVKIPERTGPSQFIVLHKEAFDADKLWEAGIRYAVPAEYPAKLVRMVILATELHTKIERASNGQGAVDGSTRSL
jgi:hypothetical protein